MEKSTPDGFMDEQSLSFKVQFGIVESTALLRALHDPEAGAVGLSFLQAITALECAESANPGQKINAAFKTFVYPPYEGESGFKNAMDYGPAVFEKPGRFFAARVHEYIHALQYRQAAALHADPFNAATDFFLSPRDYLLRKERLEQDAYVKGAWLQNLAAEVFPRFVAAIDKTPMPAKTFRKIRAAAGSLAKALSQAVIAAAETSGEWHSNGQDLHPARDLWHKIALDEYEIIIKERMKNGMPVFVRMTEKDVAEIGSAFGPNPFNGDMTLVLSPENQERLERLEHELNIISHAHLPTIDDLLAKKEQTRAQFIAGSLSFKGTLPCPLPLPPDFSS